MPTLGPLFTYGHPLDDPGCNLQAREATPDPSQFPGPTYPFCFIIHGGGFRDDPHNPSATQAALDAASRGYVAWYVTYRLAPPGNSNGKGPPGQTTPGYYDESVLDIRMALAFARADARCSGLVLTIGGSAGAYFAALLCGIGTSGHDRFDGGVGLSGPYDFSDRSSDVTGEFISDVTNYCNTTNLSTLLADSVVSQIDAAMKPFLFYNSENDPMPHSQWQLLIDALTALGVTNYTAAPLLPGNAHSFNYWASVATASLDFLDAVVAGGSGPPPPTPTQELVTVQLNGLTAGTPYEFGAAARSIATGLQGDFDYYDFISDGSVIPPGNLKDPCQGVFCLIPSPGGVPGDLTDRAWWAFSYVNGSRFRTNWNVIQPTTQNSFDWTAIDAYLALCTTHSKDAIISISCGINTPGWVFSRGGVQSFTESGPNPGVIPITWDRNYIQLLKNLIRTFGARYDTHPFLKGLLISGLGQDVDTILVNSADYAALNTIAVDGGFANLGDAWQYGASQIIRYWVAGDPSTPLYFSVDFPVPVEDDGFGVINTFVEYAKNRGRQQIGVMNAKLTGATAADGTGMTLDDIVFNAPTANPAAYEFAFPSTDPNCDPTQDPMSYDAELGLRNAANAGIAIGVYMEEFFESDILNVTSPYPTDFGDFQTALLANVP